MNQLESILRKVGWELGDHQLGRFYKIPEEMQQTPCDFMGHSRSGRVIMIEAKMVKRPSLPIMVKPGLLSHQWCALRECSDSTGLALICWANDGEVAFISLTNAQHLIRNRKSIPWKGINTAFKLPITATTTQFIDHMRLWI